MITDEIKETMIRDLAKQGKREDGRGLTDYREIRVHKNYLPNAEGSAMVEIGNTKVAAGVKFDVVKPYSDRPDEGTLTVNAELCCLAHQEFKPGPPSVDSIELARVVDRGIRSAECVNVKEFLLEPEKALGLYIDLYVLDHCGNLIDAAALAALAALKGARVPRYEDGKLIRDEGTQLKLAHEVTTCSFEKIAGNLVLDAVNAEEVASMGRLTWAVCEGDFACAAQKSGRASFSKDELLNMLDVAFEKGAFLRSKV
ncbi:MAG: RNA-binding protein [Candidatus Micrarchaeia archaeon]